MFQIEVLVKGCCKGLRNPAAMEGALESDEQPTTSTVVTVTIDAQCFTTVFILRLLAGGFWQIQ